MATDLNDQELDELDDLLARTPEPLEPLDVAMLDGYLCAVLVMPRLLALDEWLPPVFDLDGGQLPADADPAWHARVAELAQRRLAALREQIVEHGWFDPVLHAQDADDAVHAAADAVERDALAELKPASRPLFGWVAGFQYGTTRFADDLAAAEADLAPHVERVFRHLPPETDEDRQAIAALDAELPIATVDDAVADLVAAVVDLWESSEEQRFRVAPVRRDVPKVGRNDPCPCGSGRKFKHCHGG